MKKKFFFFDVDNTLAVWPDGIIPKSAQMTLDTLKANGHRVALATGACKSMRNALPIWRMCMTLWLMAVRV